MTTSEGTAPPLPLELPGRVMRRALAVALAGLLLALVLGVVRARSDTLREMEGSLDLARLAQGLAALREGDAAAGLERLRAMQGLRHLQFKLRDDAGRLVVGLDDEDAGSWIATRWHAWTGTVPEAPGVRYSVPLADGRVWTAELTASPDSEILEAASNLAGLAAVALGGIAAMLGAMHWNVKRALQPLRTLVDAIAGVERHELATVQALPAMPVRELEAIAQALRHLAAAQQRSETGRRVLAHRLMSLQEDERQRLARDLHDEFGQRLTALRVDASWLQRAAAGTPEVQRVVAGMAEQVALIQDDVRRLLARLRPLGGTGPDGDAGPQSAGRLRQMLQDLAAGWAGGGQGVAVVLAMDPAHDAEPLPQALVLGLYRITQEALTNVVRHAGATRCEVAIALDAGAGTLTWQAADDGRGIADLEAALRRGTGLAGLKDRVWTLGGRFDSGPGLHGRGLALRAAFRLEAMA